MEHGPDLLFAIGALLVLGIFAKNLLRRFAIPALVGYLLLGVGLGLLDRGLWHLPDDAHRAFDALADLGIVCLLFKVGLDSDLQVLLRELPRATIVLLTSIGASFALGFAAAAAVGLATVPALFVGVALSATSIAVAAFVWEGEGLLRTRTGALVLDVAELDDLVTVLMMVVLFAAVPSLQRHGEGDVAAAIAPAVLDITLRIVAFGGACWLFARFGERRLTAGFRRLRHAPDPMLIVVGTALLVAAFAAWLGFSLAVGALFAGLVFSRDPRAVRVEASFEPVHDLLAPFFFVAIGKHLDLGELDASLTIGATLLLAAIVGKIGGTLLGLGRTAGTAVGWIVAVSMVPRAEVALFVVDQGHRLLPEQVPASLQGAMVMVVTVTSLGTPPLLRWLIRRHGAAVE